LLMRNMLIPFAFSYLQQCHIMVGEVEIIPCSVILSLYLEISVAEYLIWI
jgi:hypothetical protein